MNYFCSTLWSYTWNFPPPFFQEEPCWISLDPKCLTWSLTLGIYRVSFSLLVSAQDCLYLSLTKGSPSSYGRLLWSPSERVWISTYTTLGLRIGQSWLISIYHQVIRICPSKLKVSLLLLLSRSLSPASSDFSKDEDLEVSYRDWTCSTIQSLGKVGFC